MSERVVTGITLTPDAAELLRSGLPSGHELRMLPPNAVTDEDLDWATVLCAYNVPAERIAPRRNIRWLHVPAAGMDPFLVLKTTRPDLRLTLHGAFNAPAVAEHALTLFLALRRGVPVMVEAKARKAWARDPIAKLQPTLFGDTQAHVLGYGPVARALVGLLAKVGMDVTVYRREAAGTDPQVARFCALRDLPREIGAADAVFGVLPGLPSTSQLLGRESLAALKPSAVVINLGRSSLIDHAALEAALRAGAIAGAALDVFDLEPLPADSPLWTVPNLIISPHVGGQFRGSVRRGVEIFLREFDAYLRNGAPGSAGGK